MDKRRARAISDDAERSTSTPVSSYFLEKEKLLLQAKKAVAKRIADKFLREGDSILLDAGTSLYPIAQEIAEKARSKPATTHFTIMTHNYKAFQILVEQAPRIGNLNIVLAGGRYDQDLNALFGPQTVMAYGNFFPRVVLIGISGMVANQGLFCHGNTEEFELKKEIFKKGARDRIVVADHSKLGLQDALCFGESHRLRAGIENCIVVTNEPPKDSSKATRERFQQEVEALTTGGVRVEVVQI